MSAQSFPVGRVTLSDRAAAGLSEVLGGPRTRTRLARIRRDHKRKVVRENSRRDFMARRCWGGMPVEPDRPVAIAECLALIAPASAECLDRVTGWRPHLATLRRAS